MAVETHFASLGLVHVDATGRTYQRGTSKDLTVAETLDFSTEHRILVDASNSNTDGNPTIETYLSREASDDFQLKEVNQSFIITEKLT